MEIKVTEHGSKVCLQLSGVVDEKGAEVLKNKLAGINQQQVRQVELDCAGLQHFGSSGIGKLLIFYKHFVSNGGELSVVNLTSPIYEMFLELKLDSLFPVGKG